MKKLLFIIVIAYLVGIQFYGRPYVSIQNEQWHLAELQDQQKETVARRFQNQDTVLYLKDKFLKTDFEIIKCSEQIEKEVHEFRKLPFCSNF